MPWEEIRLAYSGPERLYGSHEAPHLQSDGSTRIIKLESSYDYTAGVGRVLVSSVNRLGTISVDPTQGADYGLGYLQRLGLPFSPRDLEASSKPDDLFWLPGCFGKASYRVCDVLQKLEGNWCHVIETPDGSDRMWIDAGHSFLLRKREIRSKEDQSILVELINSGIEEISEGLWLPKRSVQVRHIQVRHNGHSVPSVSTAVITVKKIQVGKKIDDSSFVLEFPPKTLVNDTIRGLFILFRRLEWTPWSTRSSGRFGIIRKSDAYFVKD